eukprot:scaffold8718_cov159-Isochrysis_galbana.AAC.1
MGKTKSDTAGPAPTPLPSAKSGGPPPTRAKNSSPAPPTGLGGVKTLECEQLKSTGFFVKHTTKELEIAPVPATRKFSTGYKKTKINRETTSQPYTFTVSTLSSQEHTDRAASQPRAVRSPPEGRRQHPLILSWLELAKLTPKDAWLQPVSAVNGLTRLLYVFSAHGARTGAEGRRGRS